MKASEKAKAHSSHCAPVRPSACPDPVASPMETPCGGRRAAATRAAGHGRAPLLKPVTMTDAVAPAAPGRRLWLYKRPFALGVEHECWLLFDARMTGVTSTLIVDGE